jgi:tryptophan halogenase
MIKNVLVLGAGSAGLIAAISIKRKIPQLAVRIVRSPDSGVIGVGVGTTPNFPRHLFDYLGISRKHFYAMAQPTWKLGIKFIWGPRDHFEYGFGRQLDSHWSDLKLPNGFYCDEEFSSSDLTTALMAQGKVFARQPNGGGPDIQPWHGFHIENKKLVEVLELVARSVGVEIVDGRVSSAKRGPQGIASVVLDDGRAFSADLFIDSSGFRSELRGTAREEPYVSFSNALFCDRAVVGGWERTFEPILPYTTCETMDAGWAWQIEHEHYINRGYVFSSQFISDDDARAEF